VNTSASPTTTKKQDFMMDGSDESMSRDEGQWHLDRKVPLAIIVTLLLQTGAFIWWAAKTDARVDALEMNFTRISPQAERIVRLETKMDAVADSLNEIKALIRGK
jgi:hypothetical protein